LLKRANRRLIKELVPRGLNDLDIGYVPSRIESQTKATCSRSAGQRGPGRKRRRRRI